MQPTLRLRKPMGLGTLVDPLRAHGKSPANSAVEREIQALQVKRILAVTDMLQKEASFSPRVPAVQRVSNGQANLAAPLK